MTNQVPFSPPFRPLLRSLLLPAVVVCLQANPALAYRPAAQTVLERTVTVQAESQPIKVILSKLAKQANTRFVYSQQLVGADRKVSVRAQEP
jgi:hypothetical protein